MKKKDYCKCCVDNFYNGNNDLGVKECWSFSSAKIVRKKRVGLNERPPWNQKPIKVLSCFRQKGFVFIDENKVR